MTEYYELRLPAVFGSRKSYKVLWTNEMILILKEKFPVNYNKVLSLELNVSIRTLIRKARELGIEKEPNFLENRKNEIQKMARCARKPNSTKGKKGWSVPNSEKTRFKKGHIPKMKIDKELVERVHKTRNETIRRDKIRRKIGLSPLTKFKYIN